jgi:hypothetical protein
MAATVTTRRPSVGIVGPPVLCSVHFVFVYSFVSLACLWGWGGVTLLGVGVIEWVVALATILVAAVIAVLGLRAWRETAAPVRDDAPVHRQRFSARLAALISGLFLVSTLLVGLPTLVLPPCH